jgi:hypothetical protein
MSRDDFSLCFLLLLAQTCLLLHGQSIMSLIWIGWPTTCIGSDGRYCFLTKRD